MGEVSSPVTPRMDASHGTLTTHDRRFDRVWKSAVTRDVCIVSVVALVLGLVRLGTPSLWVDEAFTARAIQYPFPDYVVPQYHWLYYALLKPWTLLMGTSPWVLRFPSVIAAMAACSLLVVLAHRPFGRRAALASGLFLAVSPFLVRWSHQARSYTLLVAVSILATLLLIRAIDRRSRGAWLIYGVAFSAVIAIQPVSILVVVPAHGVLLVQRRERLLPHALLALIVIGVLAVPWMMVVSIWWSQDFWLAPPTATDATNAVLNISGVAAIGVPLAVAGLWVLRRTGRAHLGLWLGVWAFVPFVLAALVSVWKPVFLDRYLIAAAPAFALLAGIAVTGLGSRLRAVAVLAAVIATGVGLGSSYSYANGDNWRGENWKRAVETVAEKQGKNEPVVIVPWWAYPAAKYYGAPVVGRSTADSLWVLTWSEDGHGLPEEVRRPLGFGEHRLVAKFQFGWRVSAQHWVRTPGRFLPDRRELVKLGTPTATPG